MSTSISRRLFTTTEFREMVEAEAFQEGEGLELVLSMARDQRPETRPL